MKFHRLTAKTRTGSRRTSCSAKNMRAWLKPFVGTMPSHRPESRSPASASILPRRCTHRGPAQAICRRQRLVDAISNTSATSRPSSRRMAASSNRSSEIALSPIGAVRRDGDGELSLRSRHEIVREKVKIPELDFCLRVNFAAADLAGAVFGPAVGSAVSSSRKARDRANSLPRFSPGVDCIFTDAETIAIMPPAARNGFVAISATAYSHQFS